MSFEDFLIFNMINNNGNGDKNGTDWSDTADDISGSDTDKKDDDI